MTEVMTEFKLNTLDLRQEAKYACSPTNRVNYRRVGYDAQRYHWLAVQVRLGDQFLIMLDECKTSVSGRSTLSLRKSDPFQVSRPCSLTRNITSHSMNKLFKLGILRWKMMI